ncbi:MAG: hypothetical protein M3Q27_07630, partial [Actinomycetota bacterium]|nr:hypothetical protein [Actinomycetota bacterium]
MPVPFRTVPFLALPVLALAMVTGVPTPATAVTASPSPAAPSRPTRVDTITLVTGDRVRLTTSPEGRRDVGFVPDPADPAPGGVVRRDGEEITVIPREALAAVASGRVDPDLFNVTKLVDEGYGDAASAQLPLVLAYPGGQVAAAVAGEGRTSRRLSTARMRAPRASTLVRALPALGVGAVVARKSSARAFWA